MTKCVVIVFRPNDQEKQSWHRLVAVINGQYGEVLDVSEFDVAGDVKQ